MHVLFMLAHIQDVLLHFFIVALRYFVIADCVVVASYLLGSLTCGLRICKWFKGPDFDIRNCGSGNVGFTNVLRILGILPALCVLVADIAKVWVPIYVAKRLGVPDFILVLGILAGGFGHGFSVYMYLKETKFSGGKSVATFFGGFLAAQPIVALWGLAAWLFLALATRYIFFASIMGGVATFVASIWLKKGLVWDATCLVVVFYLTFKHIPNISRWLHGEEFKMFQKPDDVTVAFAVHPGNKKDLAQSPVLKMLGKHLLEKTGEFSTETLRRINELGQVMECGSIKDIVTAEGIKVRVLIFAIPFMPEQIRTVENWPLILDWMYAAAVQAERRGATVFGQGGLLSGVNKDGGKNLQDRLEAGGFKIKVDNGASYTAAATLEAVYQAVGDQLSHMTVIDLGARGYIARPVGESLAGKAKDILPVVRNKNAVSDDPITFGTMATSDEIADLAKGDLIISCTNTPGTIIDETNVHFIKKGAIYFDVAYPSDFKKSLAVRTKDDAGNWIEPIRPDIKLFSCGLVLLPGKPRTRINLHFGSVMVDDKKRFLVPACLAQCVLRAIILRKTGEDIAGRLERPPQLDEVHAYLEEGRLQGNQIIVSQDNEVDVYTGNLEAA